MGEDPGSLKRLCDEGLLKRNETIYSLTPRGMEVLRSIVPNPFVKAFQESLPIIATGRPTLWRTKFKSSRSKLYSSMGSEGVSCRYLS